MTSFDLKTEKKYQILSLSDIRERPRRRLIVESSLAGSELSRDGAFPPPPFSCSGQQ